MGDVPISYIEGAGGTRVSEDEIVQVGKYDVCFLLSTLCMTVLLHWQNQTNWIQGTLFQSWSIEVLCYLLTSIDYLVQIDWSHTILKHLESQDHMH